MYLSIYLQDVYQLRAEVEELKDKLNTNYILVAQLSAENLRIQGKHFIDQGIHGSRDIWIKGYIDQGIYGSRDIWIKGYMDQGIYGSRDI